MTSSLGQAAGAAILAAHAVSTAPSPVPALAPLRASTPAPAPSSLNADRVAAARARLADIERVVAGPPRLKRVRRLSAALLDDLRAAVDAAEHNAVLAGAEWGHDLVSVADQVLADLAAVRHMSVLGYLLHGRNARRVLRAHAAWLATLHAEATRLGGPRVVPAGARAMVVDLGSVSASPRSLTMESINVAPGQPLVTPLAVAAEEHLVMDPTAASPGPPLPPAQLSRLLSDSRGANGGSARNGGVSSEVAEALAKVIALANDPRFLLQLRKDSTCNFQDLLDIVEVLALACPSQAPKRLPLLTMSIESHYPPEPCHDRLSGEALQARIDQIVRAESPPMTVRRSSLVSFQSHGRRESLTERGQTGVFASVQSLTPLLETMAANDVHNPAQPSLSRITTVAAIMEQQFNPAARVGTGMGTLNSVRRGSAVSGAAATPSTPPGASTPTAAEKMAEAAPGLTMGHVWLHESARPIATIERRYPSSNRNSAILFPPPVFTRSMQNEPVHQSDSLPRQAQTQAIGNSLSRQSHKSYRSQQPAAPGSPAGATMDLSTTGPAPADLPPTPLSPQHVESDSHFDTCPVCKLVQDYSYAKYIQLAVLFHENNDLGMSYHCLVHAIQVSEERGACVPTPYFLAGLYLRHGWGCRPDLAKSFDCLVLALEYALRQAQYAAGSTMARTTMRSAGSDPIPEEIAPAPSAAAVAPPPILARPYSTMARPLSAASRTLSDVPAAAPRTKLAAYIATFRDSPLPVRDDDIEASSQRLGVALILYEVSVSLRFGWGVRGDSRLAKALAKLAANLGDPQAALEVGMRLAASSGVRLSLSGGGGQGAGSVESLPGRITRQLSRVLSRSKSMSAVGKSPAARGPEPAMLRNSWSSSLADIPEREVAPAAANGAGVRRQGSRVARRKREAVAYLRYVARSGVQDPAITWALAPKWD
ncbi:hypothetical protein AMAG_01930 [Allomyces macrogynus ATCC 38327]|uniref:Uncharacterized protein n=1 Tax=Allomyces macrogynus (strain ATCC 38327) TaxID=578462 RepID=A0A0L0S0L5_ALLM3|nr:hypothetical protein AMAG_01930 [Allomyces macrogynus ATCC 38327]|eukprot:KNE56088.1 hypothetical protein AMAG_01930 [Allomyces macrogynus ATCC 38327]